MLENGNREKNENRISSAYQVQSPAHSQPQMKRRLPAVRGVWSRPLSVSTSRGLSHSNSQALEGFRIWKGRYSCLHFTDEDTEGERITFLRSGE